MRKKKQNHVDGDFSNSIDNEKVKKALEDLQNAEVLDISDHIKNESVTHADITLAEKEIIKYFWKTVFQIWVFLSNDNSKALTEIEADMLTESTIPVIQKYSILSDFMSVELNFIITLAIVIIPRLKSKHDNELSKRTQENTSETTE